MNSAEYLKLSIPERIMLVEDIWDSIVTSPDAIQLTAAQQLEVEKRLASYHDSPDEGATWEVMRERVRKSR